MVCYLATRLTFFYFQDSLKDFKIYFSEIGEEIMELSWVSYDYMREFLNIKTHQVTCNKAI